MERHTLTTPVTVPATTEYTVRFILLNWEDRLVTVSLTDNRGQAITKQYDRQTTPTGESLMVALNKANLATKSLHARVLERLALDGVIGAGAVNGTPE